MHWIVIQYKTIFQDANIMHKNIYHIISWLVKYHYYKTWFFKRFKLTNWSFFINGQSILTRGPKHVFFDQST
jgi:hypothetical protein